MRVPKKPKRVMPHMKVPRRQVVQKGPASSLEEGIGKDSGGSQRGIESIALVTRRREPKRPAARPIGVTPPLVPRGTMRRVGLVSRRGGVDERMPSSEENVSAATAA